MSHQPINFKAKLDLFNEQWSPKVLLIEPRGVVNTGEEAGSKTAANDVWI